MTLNTYETLSFIHNSGKRRIPEKHRSIARTIYRLEAYATLLFGASSDSSRSW
jgi:hypothetical protein